MAASLPRFPHHSLPPNSPINIPTGRTVATDAAEAADVGEDIMVGEDNKPTKPPVANASTRHEVGADTHEEEEKVKVEVANNNIKYNEMTQPENRPPSN